MPANTMFKVRGMLTSKKVGKDTKKILTRENAKNHKLYFLLILEKDIGNLRKCLTKLITVYGCISRVKDIELINEGLASVKVSKKRKEEKKRKRKEEKVRLTTLTVNSATGEGRNKPRGTVPFLH